MALVITFTPEFKRAMMKQLIEMDTDAFQIHLLDSTYPGFNPTTQIYWADISAYELPTTNGYTLGGKTLTGGVVTVDTQYAFRLFNTVQWQASGSGLNIGAAAIINITANNRIAVVINNDNVLVTSGLYYTIANPTIRL